MISKIWPFLLRSIEHSLGYMVAIKRVQITLWQDEENTMGSIIGQNLIQLCKHEIELRQDKNDAARELGTLDISPNTIAGR
jgi:hypothetical protein